MTWRVAMVTRVHSSVVAGMVVVETAVAETVEGATAVQNQE